MKWLMNISDREKSGFTAIVLWVAFASLYLLLAPSIQHQNWDSLWHPSRAEGPGFGLVFAPHPVGHLVLNSVFHVVERVGYVGRGLPVFILVNAIVGGGCVALLLLCFRFLLKLDWLISLTMCLVVGGSAGFLSIVPTGDIYALTVLSSVVTWMVFIAAAQGRLSRPWFWTACAAGVATGIHQLNGALGLVGFTVMMIGEDPRKWKNVILYSLTGGVTLLMVYWVSGWVATGSPHPGRIIEWGISHFGLSNYGRFFSPVFARKGLETVCEVVMGVSWNLWGTVLRWVTLLSLAYVWLAKVSRLRHMESTVRWLVILGAGQFVLMSLLLVWWLPWSRKLWLPVLVPVVMAFGIACRENGRSLKGRVAGTVWPLVGGAMAVLIVLFNIRFVGMSQRHDTALYRAAISAWTSHSTPEDLLITAGDLNGQLIFWENRPYTMSQDFLYSSPEEKDKFEVVNKAIKERLSHGGQALISHAFADYLWGDLAISSGVSREDVQKFLSEYKWEYAFSYTNDIDEKVTPVYRVVVER